ncbi:unnamed protein product, partial [Ascophyllum nodosum]
MTIVGIRLFRERAACSPSNSPPPLALQTNRDASQQRSAGGPSCVRMYVRQVAGTAQLFLYVYRKTARQFRSASRKCQSVDTCRSKVSCTVGQPYGCTPIALHQAQLSSSSAGFY